MVLKGVARLNQQTAKILSQGSPWVYSNELVRIDKTIEPGSWVALEDARGQTIGYGHFNPYSLIAFRLFESVPFVSEEQTRALFFKRMDWAWQSRQRSYGAEIRSGEMGTHSFRLCYGESDGLPGFIVDLYNSATRPVAIIQCHSAGADQFISYAQQWLDERMGIHSGLIKNDLEIRDREKVKRENLVWGVLPKDIFALEGGVKFYLNPQESQKTGYFYDLRDNRRIFSALAAQLPQDRPSVLDCFSYIGGWGLQVLQKNPKAELLAVDASESALEHVRMNAEKNGFATRVKTLKLDLFKEKDFLAGKKFEAVIMDPPSVSSSAKQLNQALRSHEKCFADATRLLSKEGVIALAACTYHLGWDDFLKCVRKATVHNKLRLLHFGGQAFDHPVLSTLSESRYIKCVIGESVRF